MANPTWHHLTSCIGHKNVNPSKSYLFYIAIDIIIWVNLITGMRTENGDCPVECSCLGAFVDCSKKGLTKMPSDFPNWMEVLKLNKNFLVEIPVLSDMANLSSLSLSHNEIQHIDCSALRNVTSLKSLDLNSNRLVDISVESFPFKSTLQTFYRILVYVCYIAMAARIKCEYPDCRNRRSSDPTKCFFKIPGDSERNLNSNRISSVEKGSLDNLPLLVEMKLNRNHLTKFRKGVFKDLKHLRNLELNRNHFTEIEGLSFHGLESLSVLKLRRNSIRTLLDGAFWGLKNMTNLQLDFNNITSITKGWLYGLSSLHHLTLSNNHISNVEEDGWESCQHLVELDLSNNKLEAIEKETFEHLSKLQKLRLDNNRITYIAEGAFNSTPALEILELNMNRISTTIEDMNGAFVGLNRLLKFGLASNYIKSITNKAFVGLERLKKLDLSNNNITSVQNNAFSSMPELKELLINTSSLLCDCKLEWFPSWLGKIMFQTPIVTVCAYPEWLKGKSLTQVHPENFTCDDFPNPRITEDPQTQLALKGGNATLHCKAVSSSQIKMTVQWKKDNLDLQGGNITNFARSPNGKGTEHESILFLSNISDSDTGKYQCVASNNYGTTYSQKAKITVLIFPTFVKTPGNITVKTENTARLECAARGEPTPEIAWQKDGGNDFPAARERRMHVMPTDDVFFILNVKTVDMGTYSCTAQNQAGVIVANASLTVEEPPSFVKPMENKEITAGEPIVLECMASGSPKPQLTWRKDGRELVVTERHFFTADDQLLVIVDTDLSDAGTYECEMFNSLGKEQGFSQLSVIPASNPMMNESDMTGIIIITVVCCAVGTSVVWVVIIYQTRKRMGIVEVRSDDCPYPSTLLAATIAPDDRDSAPHLYLDTNSEHSSGSKDSGTGDSAGKRSSDNLLLGNGINGLVLNIAGGSGHSMEGTNHVLLGEMSNGLDTITTPPVLRSNFHPRRTNHDRCYVGVCSGCANSRSKRWSDPHGLEQPSSTPNSYYSLPKTLHPGANNTSQTEELVPCIPAAGVQ
ncbi:leucine-rich repeats and immunoglobulin-like domains protein 3 isoform X2 [Periplaneta americana]|uniref:leucine-rich repeats and immunoglobulin-like domains protein 3 isoform X2 n=1 Tax=Periplaneta americana TaxID=6978 RepID=UPI0037E9ACC8